MCRAVSDFLHIMSLRLQPHFFSRKKKYTDFSSAFSFTISYKQFACGSSESITKQMLPLKATDGQLLKTQVQ